MKTFARRVALVPLTLAIWGTVLPAYAQGTTEKETQTPRQPDASRTGAGPRGSKVGPTTNPAQATPSPTSRTGAGARGSPAGPSTNPAQPKSPVQPNNQ